MAFTGRIARFDAPGKPFEIDTVTLPELGRGETLIKVSRTNICGSDLHAWHGSFATRGLGGQLPTVLGHEMVGTVEALGEVSAPTPTTLRCSRAPASSFRTSSAVIGAGTVWPADATPA